MRLLRSRVVQPLGLSASGITAFVGVIALLWAGQAVLERAAAAQDGNRAQAPRFEVDPFWPKPLPNHWLLGNSIGLWVDEQDNVWMVHRGAANLNRDER